MTKTQQTALAAGALTIGAALMNRALRGARAIDFQGKSVLITGGSRGLGLLVARELGQEGARVTIAARDAAELERARQDLEERGVRADTIVCDVAVRDQAARLIERVIERAGRLDVLINTRASFRSDPSIT